jgi:hypothetical protein
MDKVSEGLISDNSTQTSTIIFLDIPNYMSTGVATLTTGRYWPIPLALLQA